MSTQDFNLDIPRMGYFVLFRSEGGFFGDGIMANQIKAGFPKEDAEYTHVAVSGGGLWLVDVVPPRIKVSDLKKDYPGRHIRIMALKDTFFARKRTKVAFWAATHTNLAYDFSGILNFLVKWIKQRTSNWFCSENALWALQKEYPGILGVQPDKCMPAHFLNKEVFETVWEGDIPKRREVKNDT